MVESEFDARASGIDPPSKGQKNEVTYNEPLNADTWEIPVRIRSFAFFQKKKCADFQKGSFSLPFHGTRCKACHDPVLEDHDQNDQWDCHHHRSRHDGAPGLFIRCGTTKL
jgi:hypothetical protein